MRLYQREFTVSSEEVQGADSWVKFKRLTWEEMKPFLGGEIKDNVQMLAVQVVDWNWTDEQGNPLPAPSYDVINGLITEEATWLMSHASQPPSKDEVKN